MKINDFVKAYTLFKNKSGNEDIKETSIMVSDTEHNDQIIESCLLYTSPSPRDRTRSRMPSSA